MLHWIKTHKYALVGLYLFVFLAGFGLLELVVKEPKVIIHCPVDDWIPFCVVCMGSGFYDLVYGEKPL